MNLSLTREFSQLEAVALEIGLLHSTSPEAFRLWLGTLSEPMTIGEAASAILRTLYPDNSGFEITQSKPSYQPELGTHGLRVRREPPIRFVARVVSRDFEFVAIHDEPELAGAQAMRFLSMFRRFGLRFDQEGNLHP